MADVAANLKDWSATASSNSPTDATAVGAGLADNLQEIQKVVRQDLASKGADIASAGTTDLGAVVGLMHDITGTTTINSFGTVSAGIWKILKFEGALTLTHNASSLILPGGANIGTANGDVAIMLSEGSGNWRCVSYQRANAGAGIQSLSSNYTVVAADLGKTFLLTANLTLALTAAATLGAGFYFHVRGASGLSATPLIDPNSSETIDGSSVAGVGANESYTVFCDGTNFFTRGRAFGLATTQIFSSNGTWTKPTGLRYAVVTVVGAGGGGGGSTTGGGGCGGGGGGAARKLIVATALGSTETVTVGGGGAGGTYGASAGTNGSAGGTSSFGSHCSATGGGGGVGGNVTITNSGLPGAGSGGYINPLGSPGHLTFSSFGGCGGSAALLGGGGGVGAPANGGAVAGQDGSSGSGGGGGYPTGNGGNGGAGFVWVEEFY